MAFVSMVRDYTKDLKVFQKSEFGEIRTIIINNEPWFVGKDVAIILGYQNPQDAIKNHVEKEDRKMGEPNATPYILDSLGRKQYPTFINESGLYALIFGSQLPSAKDFKHWVTSEVLPSIRKHGIYATDKVIDDILNNPDFGIELLTKLKEEREARVKAEQRNAILMHVNKTYTMTEIAKELGMRSAIELNKMLSKLHIQYKVNDTWVMYSDYSCLGYEDIKQEVLDNGKVVYHRRITQAGREFIINLINEHATVMK